MERKQSWYNVLLVICVVLLINSIPFALFIKDLLLLSILEISKRVAALVTFVILSKKEKLDKPKIEKIGKKTFLFIPFIIAFVSNFIVCWINKEIMFEQINYTNIIIGFINMLLVALVEELLFRHLLLNEFSKNNTSKFLPILYSSLIFGGIHLLNISSLGDIPYCLLQSVYTFFLGLLFAYSYTKLKNIFVPITMHFLFNFLNDVLVVELYNINYNLNFFIVNITVGLLLCVYGVILYKKVLKED